MMPCITPSLLSWTWQRVKKSNKMVVSPAEVQQALEFFAKAENPAALFQQVIKLCPGFTFRPPEQGDLQMLGDFQYLKLISGSMEFAIFSARSQPAIGLLGGNHDSPLGVEVGRGADSFACTRPEMDSRAKLGQIATNFRSNVFCNGTL